jgi:hypothetical protein
VFGLLETENSSLFQWIIGLLRNGGKWLAVVRKSGGKDGFPLNIQVPPPAFLAWEFLLTGYWNGL